MHGINHHVAPDCSGNGTFHGSTVLQAFQAFEYERMMRYDHVQTICQGFFQHFRGAIKAYQDSPDYCGGIAYAKPGIIPFFL
jgi:hypothetical protein